MRIKYFIFAMAAMAAVACSEKSEAPKSDPQAGVSADKGYIALNLKAADDITRAEGGIYEDGTEAEQAVTGATFYFFDAAGNIFDINANGNYIYVAATDNGQTSAPNIES